MINDLKINAFIKNACVKFRRLSISTPRIVAAFDFDGTLTYRDTLLPFLKYAKGPFYIYSRLVLHALHLLAALKSTSRQKIKESILTSCIAGMSEVEVRKKGTEFAARSLPHLMRPDALHRISWHLEQGHLCILVSANLDLYLEPWAKKMGFHAAITSQCEISSQGFVTGRLSGLNCRGPEKVRRLLQEIGPRETFTLFAYGDSEGDRELLSIADYAYYQRLGD